MSSACSCSNRLLTVARMPLSGSPHPGSFGRGPVQERAAEKACVRDLIHNAIERNLQTNDKPMMAVTQSKDPLNILHFATALKTMLLWGNCLKILHQSFCNKPEEKLWHDFFVFLEYTVDVTGSPQYSHSHGRLLAEKERERLAHEQQKQAHHLLVPPPVGASPRASPHHAYAPAAPPSARDISSTLRGDARDYEPHDGRHHAPSRDEMPRPPSGRLVTPPPAHSHHKAPAVTSEHAVRMHDRIYQEHREAERREAERRHPTPPGRSSAASPYGMPMTQPGVAARPPPPLINIGDRRGPSPRPTHGSISQGTPVSGQQVAQPRGGVGSISMGTPRFDPAHHRQQRDSRDVGGSISRGTPVGYDAVAAARSQAETAARAGQVYEAASMANPISMQQYNRALEVYRNLPPQAASMLPLIHQQQLQEMNSRAQLAGDFFTAQQMEEQRRKEHDKPGSPRSRESNTAPPQFAPGSDPRNPLLTAAMPQMLNYMTANTLPDLSVKLTLERTGRTRFPA